MMQKLKRLESPQNPQFKIWESLLSSRGLKKHGLYLLSGRKTVPEALRHPTSRFLALLTPDRELIRDWSVPKDLTSYELAPPLWKVIDAFNTHSPILVGKIPNLETADLTAPPRGLEVIAALGDPNNLGALLRSCAAFAVRKVILLSESAHPYHPRCLRAGANAHLSLPLFTAGSWEVLSAAHGPLIGLDTRGEDIRQWIWPRDVRLVVGEEGLGLPHDFMGQRLRIPMSDTVESLNATVAASVALFTYSEKNR